MRMILVESPFMYKHEDPSERAVGLLRNLTYARLALHDCFLRGEAPYCSHLLFPQPLILNDDDASERSLGIDAGLAWGAHAQATAVYDDLGLSTGMRYGIDNANRAGRPIEMRKLPGWEDALAEHPWDTLVRLGIYDDESLSQVALSRGAFGPSVLATFKAPTPSATPVRG